MKNSSLRRVAILGAMSALTAATLLVAPAAMAASVTPTLHSGNPTCADLGYPHGAKWDYPTNSGGTYGLGNGSVTWSTNGTEVDWTATIGVDAVIVKGGNAANVYTYDPPAESLGDSDLVTPNNASGGPAGLSHVEFCFDYNLAISAQAELTYVRTHHWTIDKTADVGDLTLATGESYPANYDVTLNQTHTDSDFAVAGTISVLNPDPDNAATLTGVLSNLQGVGGLSVNCGVAFPYVLPAGGTLNCTFAAALPDASTRLHSYQVTTTGLVGGASGSVNLVFGAPTTVNDECVQVSDDKLGNLGKVCAADTPKTFSYQLTVGPYSDCGIHHFTNTASFVTNDTQATGSDAWTVNVTVPCQAGCALTQGYWKTHSINGPAPFDDAWNLLPGGSNASFFTSGKTYYQVLWTPPSGGNAYYILAHQYIAAVLNGLNGADTSTISGTLASAKAFLQTTGPNTTLTKAQRAQVISWASILESYNSGMTGPGHCSEQQPPIG